MNKKSFQISIIILFSSLISIPLIFSDKVGGKHSAAENRTLASFPVLLTENGTLNSHISLAFTNWIDDNAGFRTEARTINTVIDTQLFKTSTNPKVHIGKNGWYFYKEDNNIEIGKGEYLFSDDQLDNFLDNIERINRLITNQNIELVFVFAPSKVSVYPEYLSGAEFSVQYTLIDQCADYLSNHSTINFINLKEILVEEKKNQPVYFRTDTHWNPEGQFVGYKFIINELNEFGIINTEPVNIYKTPETGLKDLSDMLGLNAKPFMESYQALNIISPGAHLVESGAEYEKIVQLLGDQFEISWYQHFENESVEEMKALVLADSFFRLGYMPALLAEHFSSLDVIRYFIATPSIISESKPDVIIIGISERYIPTLFLLNPNYLNPE
ncbi:MAG TPA: hypothetical protein PKK59_02970 [Anaerolineaceae bacterium]|nr:hypothetical protein [Anaerolineaceae bacterium]